MSIPEITTQCPSDETLAAFADGRLDGAARRRVLEHAETCADCYALTSAVWDFQAEEGTLANVVRPRFGARIAIPAAAASLAAAAALVVVFLGPIRDRRAMDSLEEASAKLKTRRVDGRLSGDFAYRPVKAVTRGDGEIRSDEEDALNEILLQATAAETIEKTKNPHLLGIAHLFLGEYKEAVDALTKADKAKPNDVSILSDLATAYYAWSRYKEEYLVKAREIAERAWSIEQTPQTAWNRALALNTAAAWKQYLALDSTSPWAEEARKKIEDLEQ